MYTLDLPMYCPKCKAEYRPGFTRCADCDVDLVERLPVLDRTVGTELPDASLTCVWSGEDQAECVYICSRFKASGVPFRVIQRKHQFLKGMDEHFEIGVPPNFRNKAREIIGKGRFDFTDEPEDQKVMKLPAEDGPNSVEQDNWNPSWNPEDATVEVWSENIEDRTWMIEACLRENHIHARTDVLDNGSRKILVMPHDESRAREIVRQVKDGSPPN